MIRSIKNILHLLNAFFACLYYGFPGRKLYIIGVTGTDGKTTTTHLVYEILKKAHHKVSIISTVYAYVGGKEYHKGFHTTTPSAWFLQKMLKKAVDAGDTHFVLEVTSHGLDQNRVWGIPFQIGILTNITHEHLDYHETYEKYLQAKLNLLERSTSAIINREDKSYNEIGKLGNLPAGEAGWEIGKKLITYGLKSGDVTWWSAKLTTKLPGDYNKYNVLAAYAAASQTRIPDSAIRSAIEQFSGVTGRYERIKTRFGFDFIIDFAHTPNAFEQLLTTIRAETKGRIIHVFGCTGLRDYTKRPMMGALSEKLADVSIITEDDNRTEDFDHIAEQIKSGIKRKQNVSVHKFRQDAINFATSLAKRGDVVVLTGKGHEKTILRGTTDFPWSERKALEEALKKRKES